MEFKDEAICCIASGMRNQFVNQFCINEAFENNLLITPLYNINIMFLFPKRLSHKCS